jgi:hypothetical protein
MKEEQMKQRNTRREEKERKVLRKEEESRIERINGIMKRNECMKK